MATVHITSGSKGAEIVIDNAFAGNTPSAVRLAAGRHTIVVKQRNSRDWVRTIDLTSGSDINLKADTQENSGLSAKNVAQRSR
jgi:PEGA domain